MTYEFSPRGVCARRITFELNDGIVSNVVFTGGCNGNLKAIARLVEGKPAREIADILKGNRCGGKTTSCADQFSIAITQALEEAQNN
ncbi:MAG: TIGR03905 family TSCPD domain-containing protein [Clostridia bacterium]|nr:TIGR03905 family TSCPD domain-containing protein [Clostridia bacterium]